MTDKILTNRQAIGVLDGLWSNPLFGETHRQAFEIGIKAIKALEQDPKWIPVSEKLPEEGKEVLTCSNGGFIEIQSLEDSCADIYWENQKGDWSDIDEVIAWMPLPAPFEPHEGSD